MALQSSLTLALLRCIVTEGQVYYDGLPTDGINLDALRSNVTIIPQVVRNRCHILRLLLIIDHLLARAAQRHLAPESRPI